MKALTLLSLTCLAAESLALSLPGGGLFARQQCSAYTVTNELPYEAATGLHQLSHSDLPAGGLTDANSEYIFHPISGSGTCAWSIDTGVKPDHNEYFGRLLGLWDCIGATARLAADPTLPHHGCIEVQAPYPPGFDGNGHGTHTAATILGTQYGAAPSAKLVGVKVLNAQGGVADFKDIAAAVRFAADHAKELSTGDNAPCFRGTACNLSLGIGLPIALLFDPSSEVRKAVDAAADAGLFCAVAAGNSDLDTSLFVPASAPKACTVGALDEKNVKACFSNKGGLVDVWATGVNVLSAGIADEESTAIYSGTSMASPKIAGLKLALDSTCTAAAGFSNKKTPTEACDYIKRTGITFSYKSTGLGLGILNSVLGVPLPFALPLCPANALALPRNGKRAFNGGTCQCAGWDVA